MGGYERLDPVTQGLCKLSRTRLVLPGTMCLPYSGNEKHTGQFTII